MPGCAPSLAFAALLLLLLLVVAAVAGRPRPCHRRPEPYKGNPGATYAYKQAQECVGAVYEGLFQAASTTITMIENTYRAALLGGGLTAAEVDADPFAVAISVYWTAMRPLYSELYQRDFQTTVGKFGEYMPRVQSSLTTLSTVLPSIRAVAVMDTPTGRAFMAEARRQALRVRKYLSDTWGKTSAIDCI